MYLFDHLSALVFRTDKKTSSQSLSLPLGLGTSDSEVARADGGKAVGKTCSCLRKPIAFENKAYAIGDASRCNVPCVISNITSRSYANEWLGGTMRTRQKVIIAALAVVLAVFVAPIAWSAFGTRGYFYDGRCVCGHDCFVRIQGDGYFKYSPGHGVPEHREFTLRPRDGGWEVLGLPHSDLYWSPLEGEDKVIARLRFRDGALYESWGSTTSWKRLPRAYNIWRIWVAKLLKE